MPTLFTAPLETLTADDVQGLMDWPESLTAEFKRELPGKDGRADPWNTGGKVDEFARTKLFKEIVALANTAGGHLVIGMDEDSTNKPPAACGVAPVPRCADLAERLIQMAQSIDPPIPYLVARGIPIAGDAGVVVVRVPASRAAPHRSTDREIYVRRGTSSVPVSMREVRDMVMSAERMDGIYKQAFLSAGLEFRSWLNHPATDPISKKAESQFGFRITAAPASGSLDLPRLFGRFDQSRFRDQFVLTENGQSPFRAAAVRMPNLFRPIVRGVHADREYTDNPSYLKVLDSGFISMGWRSGPRPETLERKIHAVRIIPHLLNILHVVNGLRFEAGVPEHEYQVEVELHAAHGFDLGLALWGVGFDDDLETLVADQMPMVFPRLSYGPVTDTDTVISTFATDFSDAGGGRRPNGIKLEVKPPGP